MGQRDAGICPSCFRTGMQNGHCSICGFTPAKEKEHPLALSYFHPLRGGKYFTGRILGEGGFGITYLCLCGQTRCCIKEYVPDDLNCRRDSAGFLVCPPERRKNFLEGKELFLEEARILQQFRGASGIVEIRDYFEENGTSYFVMEYLEGCNLRGFQRLNAGRRDLLRTAADKAMREAGKALGEMHRAGLIHGDVSPENIMITKSRQIKLIDFGSARSFRAGARRTAQALVKPGYAPYEMYLPDGRVGPWTDVYSLAATYYAVLSGSRVPDARERMQHDTLVPLCGRCRDILPALSDVISRALAPDWSGRTGSVDDFLEQMRRAAGAAKPPQHFDTDIIGSEGPSDARLRERESSAEPGAFAARDVCPGQSPAAASRDSTAGPERSRGAFAGSGAGRGNAPAQQTGVFLEMYVDASGVRSSRPARVWPLPADRVLKVGRRTDSDIVLPTDNMLSRDHCTLIYSSRDHCLWITDCSSHGIYRGGARLPYGQPCRMTPGEEFFLAVTTYRFRVSEE